MGEDGVPDGERAGGKGTRTPCVVLPKSVDTKNDCNQMIFPIKKGPAYLVKGLKQSGSSEAEGQGRVGGTPESRSVQVRDVCARVRAEPDTRVVSEPL